MTTPKFYRPELDVLRFVAFMLVFFFHTAASIRGQMSEGGGPQAFLSNFVMAGGYGVDIFFLLSSFLITSIIFNEIDRTGQIEIRSFYLRRILRIWPLYFAFLLLTLLFSLFTPTQFPHGAIVPMLLFFGNIWLMFNNFFSPAGILWSVSVEEQFYIFSPLIVRSLSRQSLLAFAGVLIVIAMISRFVLVHYGVVKPDALWYCTLTRLDPIATGIIVCLLLKGRLPTTPVIGRVALILFGGLCLYGAAVWLHGMDKDLSLTDAMLAYPLADVGALAIFLGFLGASIAWGPLVYLGQISYGLYVFHLLALNAAKVGLLHFTGDCPFWLRAAIALPITIGLAAVSYAWLEAPFLRLKARFSSTERRTELPDGAKQSAA